MMCFFSQALLTLLAVPSIIAPPNVVVNAQNVFDGSGTRTCVIQAVAELRINPTPDDDDISYVCELLETTADGHRTTFPLVLDSTQKKDFESKMNNGELVSNASTISFEENGFTLENDKILVPKGQDIVLGPQLANRVQSGPITGTKSLLVVRVTDKNGKVVPESPTQVSDKVFGTDSDAVNLKNQMKACSFDQLQFSEGIATGHNTAPGVIDVTIDIALDDSSVVQNRYVVEYAVTDAVNALSGVSIYDYDYVYYVLEDCYIDCGWAAYAYIGSRISVYQDYYYRYAAVAMHELGHNLGFAHSGQGSATYMDHTCSMGNPLYGDDLGKMCFNGAKNWQIGWYHLAEATFNDGTYTARMYGIADYPDASASNPVVIKLETGTTTDQFIAFNRATGVNEQNVEADNEVTIVQTGSNGLSYSQSWLLAKLSQGQTYTFSNWKNNMDLTITVEEINIAATANPGYADVKICLGECENPTDAPSESPSNSPTDQATEKSSCVDSKAWFKVFYLKQKKNCDGINNREDTEVVCKKDYNTAVACPVTCNTCDKFETSEIVTTFYNSETDTNKKSCKKFFKWDSGKKKKYCRWDLWKTTCRAQCQEFP